MTFHVLAYLARAPELGRGFTRSAAGRAGTPVVGGCRPGGGRRPGRRHVPFHLALQVAVRW